MKRFPPICRAKQIPADTAKSLGLENHEGFNRLEVRNEAGEDHAEIVLSGAIGKSWWDESGITEKEVRDAFNSVPRGRKILLKVNSEGGSMQEGLGIHDVIGGRSRDVTCRIIGYALSIASVFPLAASKVVSPRSAVWMIHKAWNMCKGNADENRQNASMLDEVDGVMAEIYSERLSRKPATAKTAVQMLEVMKAETWLRGSKAVEFGLADEGDETDDAQAAYLPLHPKYLERCQNCSPEILNALSAAPKQGAVKPPTKQQENTMNKKLIVALLKDHGIEASETETEDQLQAKLAQIPKAKKEPAQEKKEPEAKKDDLAEIRAELAAQKKQRIEDKINAYVDSNRCTKAQAKIFLAQALVSGDAEKDVFAALEEMQPLAIGGDPAGSHIFIVDEGPAMSKNGVQGSKIIPELDNLFAAHKEPGARFEAMKAEFPRLLAKAFRRDNGVQASNTFSATVTTNFLIMGAIQKLSGRFAAANLFTSDSEQDPYKPLAVGIRKFNTTATDGSQVQTNATDFEGLGAGGDSTIDPITITPAQYTSGGHITNTQLQSGFRVADIIEKKLIDLAAKITQVLTAPITVANFATNAPVISAPAAFGFSDLATLQGTLKKTTTKNLILDGEYIARIANTPGFFQRSGTVGGSAGGGAGAWQAFGWDNIALNTDWSGAGANVRGFACGQDAIGIISGVPLNPPEGIPGNIVQTGIAQLPDVKIAIATYAWFSAAARTFFFSFDNIAGATLVDELQGVLVKSA